MNKDQNKNDKITLCNRSGCITAYGKYAEMIGTAAVTMLLLIGLSALLKSIK